MVKTLIMVGTHKGAFFLWSDEKREDWRLEGPVLKGWEVLDLALDQRHEVPVLYAALGHFVWGTRIQVSRDLGQSWDEVESGPQYEIGSNRVLQRIWCIVPGHPDEPEVLFAGVSEVGLFVSRDGGCHWQEVEALGNHPTRTAWVPGLGGLSCHSILIDPTNKNRMWALISAGGVYRTEDGGKTWKVKNKGLPLLVPSEEFDDVATCPHRLVLSPNSAEHLYMQNHQGVFRSLDGADYWERCQEGLPSGFGLPMAIHARDGKTLFVYPVESHDCRLPLDDRLTIYRTRDGGESWQPQRKGLPAGPYYGGLLRRAMATDSYQECGIYFGTTSGELFYSLDDGESWRKMPGYAALPRVLCVSAAVLD